MRLNRAPAQCRVWPVIAPAAAFVRAGAVLRGDGVLLRRVLPSVYARHCVSAVASCLRSRLLFVLRQTGRLAVSCVSILPGRDRRLCVLAALFGYLPWRVHFGLVRLFVAISTGYRGREERGTGLRGWRRGFCALLRRRIGFVMLSAGSTLGLRAPNLRQRVFDSLDSLHAAAGLGWCKFAALVRFCAATSAL